MPTLCVCASDGELRAWLVDELSLMTWIGQLDLEVVTTVGDVGGERDLVIIGLDRMPPDQVAALDARTWRAPTIAIGTAAPGLRLERVLPANTTSRELKQAIRDLMY